MIQPVDIEEYLSFLTYYEKDGQLYQNHEEGKARKLATLNTFFGYFHKKEMIEKNAPSVVDVPRVKEKNIIRGREMILADIKKKGYQPQDLLHPEWEEIVLVKYDFKTWDALLAAVGYGGMKEGQVVNRLKDEYLKEKRKTQVEKAAVDIWNLN